MIKVMIPSMKPSGGPGIFMARLAKYMQKHKMVEFVDRYPNIYFTTVWMREPPRVSKMKIVYRAASAYYNSHDKKRGTLLNKKLARAVRESDYVVYQSDFARLLCKRVLQVRPRHRAIIYNGFDARRYKRVKSQQLPPKTYVACADWTHKCKRGSDIVAAFRQADIPGSQLLMIGKPSNTIMSTVERVKNIKMLGHLSIKEIVAILKSQPIFIHMAYVESCPNVVVEALSFGCAVICNNIGGTPEIVKKDGVIADCDDYFPFKRKHHDTTVKRPENLVEAIKKSLDVKWNISRPDLSMRHCAKQYLSAFKYIVSR